MHRKSTMPLPGAFKRPLLAWLPAVFGILSLLPGCAEQGFIEIKVDHATARVELAASEEQRRTGLMHRESLGSDQGLLMVFPEERLVQMWMLNTRIPLDVGFFDARGVLLESVSMQPDGGRRIYRSPGPSLYALEMNQGWFERHGVVSGARLRLPYPIEGR